jgi:DNA-binding IclR family transcriptional regulator
MNENNGIRSVQRCLAILRCFKGGHARTLAELSRAVDLSHSTVIRFLSTLEQEGYVRKEGSLWLLTPQMLELGFAALESMGVTESVQQALQRLADHCSGTANLGEKNNDRVTIIGRATAAAERRKLIIMNLQIGSSLPSTSALYSALAVAHDDWQVAYYRDANHVSIAIPVHTETSRALALGVSLSMTDYPLEKIEHEVLELLRQERLYIERLLRLAPN